MVRSEEHGQHEAPGKQQNSATAIARQSYFLARSLYYADLMDEHEEANGATDELRSFCFRR